MRKSVPAFAGSALLGLPWRKAASFVGVEAERTFMRWAHPRRQGGRTVWSLLSLQMDAEEREGSATANRRDRAAVKRLGLTHGPVICAINSPSIDIFPLEFRASESDMIETLVVNHAQRQISRPLDELVLDYSVLPDSVRRPNDDAVAVLVYSAPRRMVDTIMEGVSRLGLEVERIITPACALARHLPGREEGARHLLIDTALEATSVSVVQHGHVLLERILPWGVRRLAGCMAGALDLEEKRCEEWLSPESMSRSGADQRESTAADVDPMESVVAEVLAPAFQILTREAATSLDYCDSVLRHAPTDAVILVGALANHETFRKFLHHELNLPIRGLGDGFRLQGLEDEPDGVSYATAASCALWLDEEPS